jgi:hypothetical protein
MPRVAAKVAILCVDAWNGDEMMQPFSYAAYRIQAALVADPRLEGDEVVVFEGRGWSVDQWVERVADFAPDIIGMSAYVWSLPVLLPALVRLRKLLPELLIVLGGPAARQHMLRLPYYREAAESVDVLVAREGEGPMTDIVACHGQGRAALLEVPGLDLRDASGWVKTKDRPWLSAVDQLPSPFQAGLTPYGRSAHLQTFLGCPMSCNFCEWGHGHDATGHHSADWLTAELTAFRARGAPSVMSVDAGLNLNAKAFKNLLVAEDRVGLFTEVPLLAEVYPSAINDELYAFLERSKTEIGIGLQSYEPEVLKLVQRRSKTDHFGGIVERLAKVTRVTVELILGLPGDSPERFRRSLERVLELPCAVRVYHCLVLPDALMTKAPASFELRFNPISLEMESCVGWTPDDLAACGRYLTEQADLRGGRTSVQWPLPAPAEREAPAMGRVPGAAVWALPPRGELKLRGVRPSSENQPHPG